MDTRRLSLIVTSLMIVFTIAACNPSSSGAPSGTKSSATATRVIIGAPTMSGSVPAATPLAGAPTSTSGSGGCTNEYFPVSSGATWTYASSGSVAGDYSYTNSIAGVSDTGFTINAENAGVTTTGTWSCKDGNLTEVSSGGSASIKDTTMTTDTVSADGYVIPATFEVGKTWSEKLETITSSETKDNEKVTAQLSMQTNCTAGDTESVTVPAGKFEAVKVNCTVSVTGKTTITNKNGGVLETSPNFTYDTAQWFAKGVGMVKLICTGDCDNATAVLSSYTIP